MLRIAVCDDNRSFAAKMEDRIRLEAGKMGLTVETEVYFDGDTLVADIMKGCGYELIFLDIEMKNMNGISAAHAIRKIDRLVLLIYVSAYEQYLKELFEVEPFRFLLKPVDEGKFFDIYFFDIADITGDGRKEVLIIARYERNGSKYHYIAFCSWAAENIIIPLFAGSFIIFKTSPHK